MSDKSDKSYYRINYNILSSLYEVLEQYTGSNGAGRSALLNFLVASALSNKAVVEVLEERKTYSLKEVEEELSDD